MPRNAHHPRRHGAAAAADSPPDLRQRIVTTARQLLEQRGPAALSLREVARRAGATHQAPYHHFANREAILAELVAIGFDELADALAAANQALARRGRRAGVVASGMAYVEFALANPGLFRIMFRHDVVDPRHAPAVRAAGDRAHGELRRLVEGVHAAPDAELATLYWALVHGLACLLVDGPLAGVLPDDSARRAHAQAVLRRLADALVGRG